MQYLYHAFGSLHFATLHLFNQREQWWQGKTDTNRKGADGFSFCSSSLDRKTKSRHSRVTFVTQFKNCMDRKKLVLALVGWSRKDTATHQIINKELSKFIFNVTSFTMFTNHVIDFSLQHDGLIIFTEPLMWALNSRHWNTLPTPVRHDFDMRAISCSFMTWSQMLTPVISPMKDWMASNFPPFESCSCPSTRDPFARITLPVGR